MKTILKLAAVFIGVLSISPSFSANNGKYFDRAVLVIFENTNYSVAVKQPFFKKLADNGAHFNNFLAVTHPSQPNYIALTSGSLNGVTNNKSANLNVANIADLLEAKGLTWKVYAEDYPGNCFTGGFKGDYVRKHTPFISYMNIQTVPARCANIVNANQFDIDVANGKLPNYAFYVPNLKNSGHDTGVAYADQWYGKTFSKYLNDPAFTKDTLLISTFDESGGDARNQIYTSMVGPMVLKGVYSEAVTLYSLLKLFEENWNLGNLGKEDIKAASIPNIWNSNP